MCEAAVTALKVWKFTIPQPDPAGISVAVDEIIWHIFSRVDP